MDGYIKLTNNSEMSDSEKLSQYKLLKQIPIFSNFDKIVDCVEIINNNLYLNVSEYYNEINKSMPILLNNIKSNILNSNDNELDYYNEFISSIYYLLDKTHKINHIEIKIGNNDKILNIFYGKIINVKIDLILPKLNTYDLKTNIDDFIELMKHKFNISDENEIELKKIFIFYILIVKQINDSDLIYSEMPTINKINLEPENNKIKAYIYSDEYSKYIYVIDEFDLVYYCKLYFAEIIKYNMINNEKYL